MPMSHCSPATGTAKPLGHWSPTSLELLFEPMLQVVSTMRRFVLALYRLILGNDQASSQMALVTHELLENAIKFNIDEGASLRIHLTRQTDPAPGHIVVIRTRNRAAPEHIRVAERLIARVRAAQDPDLFYQQMLRGAAEQVEGSGLGLARIRAETEMSIDISTDGDEIEVVATALVTAGGAQ